MARLIPTIDPEEIENAGERKLAKALVAQLGRNVEVFHSFRWLRTAGRNDHLEEGEADFVIVDPENGILFIEVKGGWIRHDSVSDGWYRTPEGAAEEHLKKSPFSQAQSAMRDITGMIERTSCFRGKELPFTYGYAAAFPDCSWHGDLPREVVPDILWDAKKCQDLSSTVQKTFDRWRHKVHPRLGNREIEGIYSALFPKFGILPVLWRKVEDQEERLRRLTEDQQRLLEYMGSRSTAAIQGVAGSGKTMLALAKAQQCAEVGMKTLFVCYNTELRSWISQSLSESLREGLDIETFHSLVTRLSGKAGVEFNPFQKRSDGLDGWRDVAPQKLLDACSLLGPDEKYDAVIVDEGQDFEDLWWTALEAIFRDERSKGCYYVFYDPKQNLFVDSPSIPDLGPPFVLPVNCRNTRLIANHCAELIKTPSNSFRGVPDGDPPEFIRAKNFGEALRKAAEKIRQWCMPAAGGLKLSQTAVLVPGGTDAEWPQDFGAVKLTKNFDHWRVNRGVLIATWSRFKGLEADAIVIIDKPESKPEVELRNQYVARSRAKHLLVVIEVGAD